MTFLESLPRNNEGEIEVPVFGMDGEGNEVGPGTTTEVFLNNVFADYVIKSVPLAEQDYQNLLSNSSEIWKRNWQKFREQEVI